MRYPRYPSEYFGAGRRRDVRDWWEDAGRFGDRSNWRSLLAAIATSGGLSYCFCLLVVLVVLGYWAVMLMVRQLAASVIQQCN